MSDYRVINRKTCKCGSTEVSTEVIVHILGAEVPELKPPAVPEISCEICEGVCDREMLRR